MTMIFTTPQRSKKRKPTAKQRELSKSWGELLKKYPAKNLSVKRSTDLSSVYSLGKPACRETPKIPSLPFTAGPCTKPAPKQYTGTKVKGIGTMHKSNAVPIFSDEEAKDIATMRRG